MQQSPPRFVPMTLAMSGGVAAAMTDDLMTLASRAGARLEPERLPLGPLPDDPDGRRTWWHAARETGVMLAGPAAHDGDAVAQDMLTALGLPVRVLSIRGLGPFARTRFPWVDTAIVFANDGVLPRGVSAGGDPHLIVRTRCERVVRAAFELARARGRRRVTCVTRDRRRRYADALLSQVFDRVAFRYPDLEADHATAPARPEVLAAVVTHLDVVVAPSWDTSWAEVRRLLHGHTLGAFANLGRRTAVFSPAHGAAPKVASAGMGNPSGMVLALSQLLGWVDQGDAALRLANAWFRTLEDGVHTADLFSAGRSRKLVGAEGFFEAVTERLGDQPVYLRPVVAADIALPGASRRVRSPHVTGVDVTVDVTPAGVGCAETLARQMSAVGCEHLELTSVAQRGAQLWPAEAPGRHGPGTVQLRFAKDPRRGPLPPRRIDRLVQRLRESGLRVVQARQLYTPRAA